MLVILLSFLGTSEVKVSLDSRATFESKEQCTEELNSERVRKDIDDFIKLLKELKHTNISINTFQCVNQDKGA